MRDYTAQIFKAYNKLGFQPRDNQIEIINNIVNSFINEGYTNVILCAGTGHGKSIIAMVTQLVLKELNTDNNVLEKANIIMNTNVLIDQYVNSFKHLSDKDFFYRKGANNYVCDLMTERLNMGMFENYKESAEMCVSDCEKNCKYSEICVFNQHRKLARTSKCIVSNYSYWMTLNLFARKKEALLLNVFDECHTMNDVFSSFAAIELTTKLIDYLIKLESVIPEKIKQETPYPTSELEALKNSLRAIEIKDEFDFSKYRNLTAEQKLKISQSINQENYEHFLNTIDAIQPILETIKDITCHDRDELAKGLQIFQEELASTKVKLRSLEMKKESNKKLTKKEKKEIDELRIIQRELNYNLNTVSQSYSKITKGYNRVNNILFQIDLIKDDNEILFEKINTSEEEGIRATPVFIKKYWKVLNNSKYNLFMSATVTKDYVERTIDLEGMTKFIFVPSSFPKENKLIVRYKEKQLNYNTLKDPRVIDSVIKSCYDIVNANSDVNGIILTTNFELTRAVANLIRNNKKVKVFEHKQGEKIADILTKFKEEPEVSVLISPSLWEGISLDDDTSRYQIVCKTPYGSLASKRNKFIQVRLPEIYQQQTLLTLIQGFGRSVRNKDDFCVTYCLDINTRKELDKPYNVWKNDYTYETVN